MTVNDVVLLMLGGLGLLLIAGGVLALVLEVMLRKPHYWQGLALSGAVYIVSFTTEPPAAWRALSTGVADSPTAWRTLALGVFIAGLSRAYIAACRGRG